MDVDTTNQSAPGLGAARSTPADPRLNRVSNTSQNGPQVNRAPTPSMLRPTPRNALPEQQTGSNSPSTGCPPGFNELLSAKELESGAPTYDLGKIVPSLAQFCDAHAALFWRQQEKAVLEKEDALLRKNLNRAKTLPASFSSLVDTIQNMKDKSGLQKLDEELTKQQARCSSMAEELRAMLRAASCSSEKDKTLKLQARLKEEWEAEFKEKWKAECKDEWKAELRAELADAEKRLEVKIRSNMETEQEKLFSDLRERLQADLKEQRSASSTPTRESHDHIPSEFLEKFGRLENSVNFMSTSNRNLGKQILRVEKWKRDVEEGRIRLPSQSEAPAGARHEANLDLEKLKEQIPTLETRVGQIEQQHTDWSGLKSLVKENTAAIHLLKSAREVPQPAQQNTIATLETQIRQVQELATISSERIASLETQPRPANREDSGNLSEQVNQLSQQIAAFRGVAEELNKHSGAIHDHSARIEACKKMQETMTVALRSLEHRYLNINSEELVKSMSQAMIEMYPGIQKVPEQLKSLQLQINANKDEFMKEANRFKSSLHISERFAQLQETQREQADSIVRYLEEVKELRNLLEGYSVALAELGDKQADDLSDLSEELKALVPRFGEYDTRLEIQAKQYRDLEETLHHVRTQLDTFKESVSEDNITRICENAQREKLQFITGHMEEFNSQCKSLLQRLKDIQDQRSRSSDLRPESLQSLTNGLLSASGFNGSSSVQQSNSAGIAADRAQLPAGQRSSNVEIPVDGSQDPKDPRVILPNPVSSPPSPGAADGSFRIKGVASQNDSERGLTSGNPQSTLKNNSHDPPISSGRVTATPQSPTVTIPSNRSAATVSEIRTKSSAPSNGEQSNPHPQASTGKKRQRRSTTSDDESHEERRMSLVSSNSAKLTPAPSSASDVPLRKSKKTKKKEERQSQLK